MEPGGCVDNYAISEFGLAGVTATNTSPISALLRVLAISNPRQPVKAIGHSTTIVVDATTEDESSAYAMLLPLDEWMSHRDKSDMTVLRNSLLVTSPGMVSIKDDEEEEDEESTVTGTAVKDLLGTYWLIYDPLTIIVMQNLYRTLSP